MKNEEYINDDLEEQEDQSELPYSDETVNFWEEKQRELLTSVVDYNLESLSQLITKRTIDLFPGYQRRFRWDNERKSKLIESFLMNVPVPPIFLNEDRYGKYSVIDGKQRLSAVNDFITVKLILQGLEVFSDINGCNFFDLPEDLQNVIKLRPTLRAIIILRQSDNDVKFEVFQRLNTGGVTLNPQEIRNSTYPGPLNDLILELSEHPEFHKLLGIRNKNESSIYQEMRDAEMVLRFFTYKDSWGKYTGSLKMNLDHYMVDNQFLSKQKLKIYRYEFLETLDIVRTVFGEGSFRRWLPQSNKWRNMISMPLFDAQMLACFPYRNKKIEGTDDVLLAFKNLFTRNSKFVKSIESSTGTPINFLYRINTIVKIMKDNITEV